MAQHQSIRSSRTQDSPGIPDKLYFRIGEVASLCAVPAYVLRFWESEFPQLKPAKGGTGQRLFRRRDVDIALRIKSLLYDQGYTIPGARQIIKSEAHPMEPLLPLALAEASPVDTAPLRNLQRELRELLQLLTQPTTRNASLPMQSTHTKPRRTDHPRTPVTSALFDPVPPDLH